MKANDGAIFGHLFHDLIMSGFAKVTFLLLKHDFEEVALLIVPDGYVLFFGHKTLPFLTESVKYAVRTKEASSSSTVQLTHYLDRRRASVPHLLGALPWPSVLLLREPCSAAARLPAPAFQRECMQPGRPS